MKNLYLILLLTLSVLVIHAQVNVEKYSKVKIFISDKSDIIELQRAGLDLEGMKLEEKSVELTVNQREIEKLDRFGFSYQILIDDMGKYYAKRNRRIEKEMQNLEERMKIKYNKKGFGFGSIGGYYTFEEVVSKLDSMRILYPELITEKDSIGRSVEGRAIWAVKISDNPEVDENEPKIFYNSLTQIPHRALRE